MDRESLSNKSLIKYSEMENKFGELDEKRLELDKKRKDVEREVDTAYRKRLGEVKIEVQTWLDNVMKVKEEVTRIRASADQNNNGFLHFCLRYTLASQAADQIHFIDKLLQQEREFNGVSHSRPPPSTTGSLLVNYEGYAMFESRESSLNEILDALKDETVHMIGVYGMGGIGKTTLVKEAANKAMKEYGLFTEVVMVTVSQNLDVKRIQTGIAESLGLRLDEESVEVRAASLEVKRIRTAAANKCLGLRVDEETVGVGAVIVKRIQTGIAESLGLRLDEETVEVRAGKIERRLMGKEGNRVLVIFDDLWEMLELSKVRIPYLNNKGSTCRVIITTRREDVCVQMGCQKKVELRTLSDEESWLLFNSKAEINVVDESPTMKEVAWDVAKQCTGLPLALVVLGTTLKGKKLDIWKTVLNQLKKSTMALDLAGVSNKVRQSIELSYNFLESEAAKWCFLHCCLYPEDNDIKEDDLMHMLVGGGLLEDDESLHEAQDRVHVLMDQLKASCLLLEGRRESNVRMHDVVRDVAIWIGERDRGFFVRAGQGLEEWPRNCNDAKKLQNCRQLSLMSNKIVGLPSHPIKCMKLETLILSNNLRLRNIPEKFFQHMGALKVLDLSHTNISHLPESLSSLTNLRVLNLKGCSELEDISPINGLKMLTILVLTKTRVSVVPEDTGGLLNLRLVDLGKKPNTSLSSYFSNVLQGCSRLEQLFIPKYEECSAELASLRFSTHLNIWGDVVDSNDSLSQDLGSRSWTKLQEILICFLPSPCLECYLFPRKGSGYMHLTRTKHFSPSLKALLFQLKRMTIMHCPEMARLLPYKGWLNMHQLEKLEVMHCITMLQLFPYDHIPMAMTELLPKMVELNLSKLPQLKCVLQPFQCLPNLMILRISYCGLRCGLAYHEMEMVAGPFPKLEELYIDDCMEMSQIISSSSPDALLQGMCIFQNLRHLYVHRCPRLTHLFWSKQAKHMQQLTSLKISECDSLTAVVISNENQEERASASTSKSTTACMVDHHGSHSFFPQLTKLVLRRLPKIVAFPQPIALQMEWPYLVIEECPKLETPLLVITTRQEDVCKHMECQKKVEMGTLSDEESCLLFKRRAGIMVYESQTMKEVAKECAGLPLALVVLGTALKGKKLEVWKTVLKQLKKSTMVPVLPGVNNKVRESIELSYNILESEEAKLCFLHCCLYPEDYDIEEDDLMRMLVGGGLLEDVENLHKAQDRVHVLMDQLKALGLLLEGRRESCVRMHDVVRDVAIWIGEKDHGFFVRAGQGLEEWPRNSDAELQNCRRLSLMFNEIVDLPSDPINCTKLEILILCGNRKLSNIPEKFFQHMKALKVLDLSFTNISCLPESLSCLTSLRVLNLKRCEKLRDKSPINGLRMSEKLILKDIKGAWIIPGFPYVSLTQENRLNRSLYLRRTKQFPPSLKDFLEEIKTLALVDCQESEIIFNECDIPPHVFLNLEQLQVLNCLNLASFDFLIDVYNLGREKQRTLNLMNRGANFFDRAKFFYRANSSDKSSDLMFQLKIMKVENCPKMARLLPSKVGKSKDILPLEKLEVTVCSSMLQLFPYDLDHKPMAMTKLLPKLKILQLVELPQLESVLQPFQCLPNLRSLRISKCGLRCGLAYHEMEMAADPFPKLKKLEINGCKEMSQMIISSSSPDAPLQGTCIVFQNLCDLEVSGCPRLTHLFWSKQAKHMQQLTSLIIDGCSSLRVVVMSNENQEVGASTSTSTFTTACAVVDHHGSQCLIFPRLTRLNLSKLPQLESVLQPFQCLPNLMELEISECGLRCGLAYHGMEMVAADPFPKLEKLDIKGCWEMSQMISSSSPDSPLQGMCIVFQNLSHLVVDRCPRLTHLFWSKQAKHMQQLTQLLIGYCESLTAVVISNENQEDGVSYTSTSTSACIVADHPGSQYNFFPLLTKLILKRLPKFAAFHQPIASSMEWPCLEEHLIEECPKLETPLLGAQTSKRSRVLEPDEVGFEEDYEEDYEEEEWFL